MSSVHHHTKNDSELKQSVGFIIIVIVIDLKSSEMKPIFYDIVEQCAYIFSIDRQCLKINLNILKMSIVYGKI